VSERANELNPSYGPGLGDDLKELGLGIGKVAGSIALAATTVVCPPAGIAATAVIGGGGALMTVAGRETGNKDLEKVGMTAVSMASGSTHGSLSQAGKSLGNYHSLTK